MRTGSQQLCYLRSRSDEPTPAPPYLVIDRISQVQVLCDNLKEQLEREGYESRLSVMDAFGSLTHALVDPSLYRKIQEKLWEAIEISKSYYTALRSKREQFLISLSDAYEKVQARLQVCPPCLPISLPILSALLILILPKTSKC
jgi:KaiC/GvpD/RAD55 family RecA-like ATPase